MLKGIQNTKENHLMIHNLGPKSVIFLEVTAFYPTNFDTALGVADGSDDGHFWILCPSGSH